MPYFKFFPSVGYGVWSKDAINDRPEIHGDWPERSNTPRLTMMTMKMSCPFLFAVLNFTNFHLILYGRKCFSPCKALVRSE